MTNNRLLPRLFLYWWIFWALFGGPTLFLNWSMLTYFVVIGCTINVVLFQIRSAFLTHMSDTTQNTEVVPKKSRFSLPPLVLLSLGLISFISSIGEGIVSDWRALLLLEKFPI